MLRARMLVQTAEGAMGGIQRGKRAFLLLRKDAAE
jgi:hypothetical protein